MPKLKSKKAILKRFKITGTKKLMCRKPGQNHFNAKESGNVTRRKRKTSELSSSARKSFKKELSNL